MKTAIIGLGLIGGSMAIDLRKSGVAAPIIGVDNNPGHAARAMELAISTSRLASQISCCVSGS